MESAAALLVGEGTDDQWYMTPVSAEPKPKGFVVWVWEFDKFPEPPERTYNGKTICVRGQVKGHAGEAEAHPWWVRTSIYIDSPNDITTVE